MLHVWKELSASVCRQSIHYDICPVAFQFILEEIVGLDNKFVTWADAVQGMSGFDEELNLSLIIQICCHSPLFLTHLAQLPTFYLASGGTQFYSAGTRSPYLSPLCQAFAHIRTGQSSFLLLSSFPSNTLVQPCCQALIINPAKVLWTYPVWGATKCCPLIPLILGGGEGAAQWPTRSPHLRGDTCPSQRSRHGGISSHQRYGFYPQLK